MSTGPSEDFCCEECFNHAWLRALAKDNQRHTGCCFYCGNCAALTAVPLFKNGFVNLLKDYMPAFAANGGRDPHLPSVPVIEAIQRDWKLFSMRCSPERLQRFLQAVFKGDPVSDGKDFTIPVVPFHRNAMSTILAAEKVGRVCYAIEIDPLYVDVAVKRWEKRTGEKAVCAATGECFDQVEVPNA